MKKILFFCIIICLFFSCTTRLQKEADTNNELPKETTQHVLPEKMNWFANAKLGIFIHYGIYAVDGVSESWSFYSNNVPYDKYMKQLDGFTARNYNPDEWAMLFKEAGAKYAVLTSKHHDGVALWDTKQNDLSIVKKSPAGKGLLIPFAAAMRKKGLKVGIYFSVLDWSHPDYATVFNEDDKNLKNPNPYDYPVSGKEDTVRWNNFLSFNDRQIRELQDLVQPDLWWFDGDWTRSAKQWKMKNLRQKLLSWNPDAVLNSRMRGYGDYATPEQGIPIFGPKGPWELCMTINDSWGYQTDDNNHKSINYIIRVFSECISLGGNLLLDVGPMEDGTITPIQTQRLKQLGRWTKKHAEAIYGTQKGLPFGYFFGPTTISKDHKTIYCFILDTPKDDIIVKGIQNKIQKIRVLGTEDALIFERNGGAPWNNIPGVLQISIPPSKLDENVTVIAIELDKPLELYKE